MSLPFKHKGETVRVSLMDAFKSSRAMQEERDAIIRKRVELAENQKKFAAALAQDKKGQAKAEQSGKSPKTGKVVATVPPNPNIGSGPIVTTGPPQTNHPNADNPPAGSNGSASWTAEQDAELRHLKSQKKFTWKAAAGSLGKSESELKSRWNEINAKKGENGDRQGPEPGNSGEEKHEPSASRVGKTDKSSSKGTSKKGLYVDENFTLEEVILLNCLASKYEDDKWLRISSRFYDKTGKRITPQDAKKHVEQGQGGVAMAGT